MHIFKLTLSVIGICLGVFLFIFGGYDDSPGAQGLGLLIVLTGLYNAYKSRTKPGA